MLTEETSENTTAELGRKSLEDPTTSWDGSLKRKKTTLVAWLGSTRQISPHDPHGVVGFGLKHGPTCSKTSWCSRKDLARWAHTFRTLK